jgi:phenylacetate-CoA ligase
VKSNLATLAAPPSPSRLEQLISQWREVPLYRPALARRELSPANFDASTEFFRLPFITKRDMREGFPGNFLRTGQQLETLLNDRVVELEHTSGTSEEQTPVLFGRGWWDAQEQRALRLNAVVAQVLDEFPDAKRATLTTPTCNGSACYTNWMSRPERTFGRTLFSNLARIPFLLKEADLARMAAEIVEWAPQFLDLDPVHGAWFALYCEKHGIKFPSLRFILCSYEFVSVVHRRILHRVFGVPVLNLYGSTETGHLLMEDEHGAMKPSDETAFLEIVDPDSVGVGDLVVTTLSNDYMPLVRYRIGDLVERLGHNGDSSYRVHGRTRDALRNHDGRRITTLDVDQCFGDVTGIVHYQLKQRKNGASRLTLVPDGAGPDSTALSALTSRLQGLLHSSQPIATEIAPMIPPTPSGKFRLTLRA